MTVTALLMISSTALSLVSPNEASQLGNELTPIGAQASKNVSGVIPAYTGGLPHKSIANPLENIYKNEKPLFVITSENLDQYKQKLTQGQLALFAKYPATYKMPVYETHRSAAYPQHIYAKAKKNATNTELTASGNGLKNFDETIPFALPKNGLEVIWNHVSRYRGGAVSRTTSTMVVQNNGSFTPIRATSILTTPHALVGGYDESEDDNILFYFRRSITSPARFAGNHFLAHETLDQVKQARIAWLYNSGQRRTRRAPSVAYDAPVNGSEGLRTVDEMDMFNGAPDRFNWKLVGKKEIYIPYNSYKIADEEARYADIIQVNHLNQDYTRYELHRVWKVEATLKEKARHLFGKRTFYVDEDTWQIALSDSYDAHGNLSRIDEGHPIQLVNADVAVYASTVTYDLLSGRYLVELSNEERNAYVFGKKFKRKEFKSSALRRAGK